MEIWRDIPGYEGRYQVSDEGRVRSVDRMARSVSKAGREFWRTVYGKVLSPGRSRGYQIVNIHPTGTIAVHLLVARTWLPVKLEQRDEANHIDGDKTNNRADNLEWVSKSRNQQHAVALGLRDQAVAVTDGTTIWPSCAQAAFEITGNRNRGSEISRVIRGERPRAFNREWWMA